MIMILTEQSLIGLPFAGHKQGRSTNLFKQIVECKICQKKLQLKNLKAHITMVHDKVKPFKCELCGKMFGTRFLVREHMESHKVGWALCCRDVLGTSFSKYLLNKKNLRPSGFAYTAYGHHSILSPILPGCGCWKLVRLKLGKLRRLGGRIKSLWWV